jgi:hypothetical protein
MSPGSATVLALALIAGFAGQAAAQPLRYSYEIPAENIRRSNDYDRLLSVSASFRHYRMRKECSPIDFDAALRQDCIGSFDTFEPIAPGYR